MEKQTHKLFPTLVHYFKELLYAAQLEVIFRHDTVSIMDQERLRL